MKTFWEYIMMREGGLWMRNGPQDNPGTRRKNPIHPYNRRYGSGGGMQQGANAQPMPKMNKK